MNNGSVLNSLLTISGAGIANAKNASAQNAKSDSDDFQTTFDRVRPEVAVRKPDARRDAPPKPTNKAPVDNQRVAEKTPVQRDLANNRVDDKNHQLRQNSHQVERSPTPESKVSSQKPGSENTSDTKEAGALTETSTSTDAQVDGQVEQPLEPTAVLGAVDSTAITTIDPLNLALTIAADINPEEVIQEAGVVGDPATLSMQLTEAQLVNSAAVLNSESVAVALSNSVLVNEAVHSDAIDNTARITQVVTTLVGATSVTSDALADGVAFATKDSPAELNLSAVSVTAYPTMVEGALQAVVQGAVQNTGQVDAENMLQSTNSAQQALSRFAPGSVLANADTATKSDTFALAELGIDLKPNSDQQSSEQAAPELADVDLSGDNPDFLLLNSKAALNKLNEANLTSLDKVSSLVDAAKPAAATSPALEALTRLTESQSPAARAFVVQTAVPVTVGQPQWTQAVGEKVLWLAAQNVSAAEIRLDPPELGPMQVRVSVNQEQASVTFTSPHPMVRDVLDQQLNRLREMFAEQGLNLVNVDVSDKSFAQQEREKSESGKSQAVSEDEELAPLATTTLMPTRLVDHYA